AGTLRRDAPAGRFPAHPGRRQAGAAAGRAVRLARRDQSRRDAGVAGGGAACRRPHRAAGQPRPRGGALPRRPGAGALGPAGEGGEGTAGPRSARVRPRRRRHRSRLRRRPRGRPAGAPCGCRSGRPRARRPARRGGAMNRRVVLGWILPVLVIAALIGLWQIAASTGAVAEALNLEPFLVPSPAEVGDALWTNRSVLWENTWVTLREILIGLAAGIVAGIALAVAMRFSRLLRDAIFPLSVAVQAVPVVVIAPILVVWVGFGIWVKVIVVALACFFPILVNTLDGLRSVDPEAV